ncbi:MAG TPA: hypothetical protein VGF48_20460 [Thermoanaerobaculia bacterium]|jgi:uncharacterized membrane protein YgcG
MTKKLAMVLLLVAALVPRPAAALETNELLALVAMPLAVAAVSEVTDVPMNELMNFVSLLNQAEVPPTQFVEVVRYVPVALEDRTFVESIRSGHQSGLSGSTLVTIIEDRYRTVYGQRYLDFDDEPNWNDASTIVPAVVRNHPHGGPPGQLKKQRGVQTGAEVVHDVARKPARVKVKDRDGDQPVRVTRKPSKVERHQVREVRDVKPHKVERREVKAKGGNGKGGGGNGGGNGNGNGNGGGKKGKG